MRWVCHLIEHHICKRLLYFQSVDDNPLYSSAERWQAFLKSLYLMVTMIYPNKLHFVLDHTFNILCGFGFRLLIRSEDMVKKAII